jgi:hypothetical protein
MPKKPGLSWLNPKGSVGEAKARAAADAAERKAAGESPRSIILNPDDVRGDYDAGRVLFTTLGGHARPLTHSDLQAFRKNMRTVQNRLSGAGITAGQVLDFAKARPLVSAVDRTTDLTRSNTQIRVAVPSFAHVTRTQTGQAVLDMRFITNAGPESQASRHHVHVRFLGFAQELRALQATPSKSSEKDKGATSMAASVNRLRGGYLAFDCDCERHRFVYRYISTVGGFNAGRAESGYPKITNPKLYGVACKHVLRVMGEVSSSRNVAKFIGDALTKALGKPESAVQVQTKTADLQAQAKKQKARPRDLEKLAAKVSSASRNIPAKMRAPATRRTTKALKEGRIEDLLREVGFLSPADRARLAKALESQK